MADFPYTPNPASAKRFLDHVQSAGIPEKVTQKYLEKVGFKSTNDRYLIGVLKFIGFLDGSGVPTKTWQAYRNRTSAGATLAAAIRLGYKDLFITYPDAQRKDNEALRNYFSAHTKVAESTLSLIVTTFKTLCNLASFDATTPASVAPSEEADVTPPSTPLRKAAAPAAPSNPSVPPVTINIQLQLPATSDADIYDKLFAALKKHLL